MPAYLSKVNKLGKPIILVDAFAGPGKYGDGERGSPHIICEAAEKLVPGKYIAIFVNSKQEHHDRLSADMDSLIKQGRVITILGKAEDLLGKLRSILNDQTLFIYLDPFGLRGCEFKMIEPFLKRDKRFSTEIVINLSVPIMHRLAARNAISEKAGITDRVKVFHETLSRVLGGDYWKEIMWEEGSSPDERAETVLANYRKVLHNCGAEYSGSCPVKEKTGSRIKYYITFCSRHPDALLLMNDAMCAAYHQRTHEAETQGTLFEGSDWRGQHNINELEDIVCREVETKPGRSRLEIWRAIVQGHFMRYLKSEYRLKVDELCSKGILKFEDVKGTGRLNDGAPLLPGDKK